MAKKKVAKKKSKSKGNREALKIKEVALLGVKKPTPDTQVVDLRVAVQNAPPLPVLDKELPVVLELGKQPVKEKDGPVLAWLRRFIG